MTKRPKKIKNKKINQYKEGLALHTHGPAMTVCHGPRTGMDPLCAEVTQAVPSTRQQLLLDERVPTRKIALKLWLEGVKSSRGRSLLCS